MMRFGGVGGRSAFLAALSVCLLAAGCSSADEAARPTATVRDSAGVRIVENPATPVDTVVPGAPLLTLGREGQPLYEFDDVRFVGGLSDGRIVVADGGSSELRFYEPGGTWAGAAGGAGDGPGEFRRITGVQLLPGDTLAVLDAAARRVSYVAADGSFAGSVSWVDEVGEMDAAATLCTFPGQDGVVGPGRRLVLRGWGCLHERGSEGPVSYVHTLRLWDSASGASDTLGTLRYFDVWERPGREIRERFASMRFTAGSLARAWSGGVMVPSHRAHRIDVYGPDGAPRLSIRDAEPRRVTDAAARQAWTAQQDSADLAYYEGTPFPDSLPAFYQGVRADRGYWARHYDIPGASGEHWRIYGDDGVRRGVVAFPEGFTLQSVRDRRAYGFTTGPLGIQRPTVYAVPDLPGG